MSQLARVWPELWIRQRDLNDRVLGAGDLNGAVSSEQRMFIFCLVLEFWTQANVIPIAKHDGIQLLINKTEPRIAPAQNALRTAR